MKIEVGEYVRTKYGITQFKAYETMNGNKLLCMPVKDGSNGIFANIEDIIKSSPNIIDLIEVGDYVNGKYVYKNGTDFGGEKCLHMESSEVYACENFIYEKDIKNIVTKEQISNMEYRV